MKEPLQKLVTTLEDDLRQRISEVPELAEHVAREHREAERAGRTGESLAAFGEQLVTQAAVAWVLAAVFVRFLEDAGLLDEDRPSDAAAGGGGEGGKVRWIAGGSLALIDLAADRERGYFRRHPRHGEREYLLHVFAEVGALPGLGGLFDREHTPLWKLAPSADGARALIDLFRRRDPESGEVELTFGGGGGGGDSDASGDGGDAGTPLDTRFLGDLYQELSEAARKRYALLQTPEFVESFLLDRSLEPAIARWGLGEVRLIDPACGSGHFLLGAFHRLLERHRRSAPAENPRVLVQRALDQVAGVDLNPFAAAIARFRLLVAALSACGVRRLAAAPAFRIGVAAGDSLLHGRRPATRGLSGELFEGREMAGPEAEHFYASEDRELLEEIFARRYHAVVANPPYITMKDPGLRDLYRARFESCHGKYSLVCPFLERILDLAADDGYVAAIVGNAFMKRQFGKKLVEEVLPQWDLTHVVDTSGAYLPGHGTPTVILLARAREPVAEKLRAVLGIRGEPTTPSDPALGKVWTAIVEQIDTPGSESEWISVSDFPRERMAKHPWSLQGGGASDLKKRLDTHETLLGSLVDSIGITCFTLEDDQYLLPPQAANRLSIKFQRAMVLGDGIRDWSLTFGLVAVFPYDHDFRPIPQDLEDPLFRYLWPARTNLANNKLFGGKTKIEGGLEWYEFGRLTAEKLRTPLSIALAFVATHNHFVLDRGGKVFKQTAPVIKLPEDATEDDHLGLLGLLNSSTGCFWIKNTCFERGGGGIGGGIASEAWERFYEHDGTKLQQFPLPEGRPLELARGLDELGRRFLETTPAAVCGRGVPSREALAAAEREHSELRRRMIALQEELDWRCYRLYGLLDDALVSDGEPHPVELGERAFEIALARRVAAGEVTTSWFERHGSTPRTELPAAWPEGYRRLVERRLAAIAEHKAIGLVERPEYKRRWSSEPWQKLEQEALRGWLLDRLEQPELWSEPRLLSTARLADRLRRDPDFLQVAALYRGRDDFDLTRLVTELVEGEGVPYLARQRYKPSGLRKREVWEEVWRLQRAEDALDARAALPDHHPDHLPAEEAARLEAELDLPVPPKYNRADFASATTWSLRGKLDVPKERFLLHPGAERSADPTPVVGWAGWNHLERARALAAHYVEARDHEAWSGERLAPLLDGLEELLPWLLQWHDEVDPAVGMGLGSYFEGFVEEERRRLAARGEVAPA